jgi:hypothetical protein
MIRPRSPNDRPRRRYDLDEDDLMDQALGQQFGDDEDLPPDVPGPSGPGGPSDMEEVINIVGPPGWQGDPGRSLPGPFSRPPASTGGLGGATRTVQTGPNNTMPIGGGSGSGDAVAGMGGTSRGGGTRRVPLSGRENQANLWGIHNPEVWENADSPDLNRRALRVLMRYGTTPDAIRQAMQDPDWLADPDLAGATYNDGDRINFHGALSAGDHGVPVNEVDVLAAYDANTGQSQGLRWGDVDAMGAMGGGGDTSPPPSDGYGDDMGGGSVDMEEMPNLGGLDVETLMEQGVSPQNIQQILAEIRRLMGGQGQSDALLGGALEEQFR